MKKNECTLLKLSKAEVSVYDFGSTKLHAYKTNDFLSDEVFIVEKAGKAVIIEQPCFIDNIGELTAYIESLQITVDGKLLSYHMAGASFLPDAPVYATENAEVYGHKVGGKALIESFAGTFGAAFDSSISAVTNHLSSGSITLAGIEFIIIPTPDAFNIEIPELCTVYTHMLGHDCHSIIAGAGHADAIIAEMDEYIQNGYSLILSSHYTPENLKDAQTKIDYIKDLKQIAAECADVNAFKSAISKKYANYDGSHYLDMTAGFFFPGQ